MTSIDVVIPNFNGEEMLKRCLEHLGRQTVNHTVTVVDNGSSDGSSELVKSNYPQLRLIELAENIGYGQAVMAGVEAGSGEALVVINNDVFCDPEFVEKITSPLDEKSMVAMVAGLLLRPGRELIDSFGIEIDPTLAAYNRLSGEPVAALDNPSSSPFLGPNGGAAAYLRSAFEEVGGFDRKLFAYYEDVDLALRLRSRGWKAALANDAVAIHLGGATAGVGSLWQTGMYSFGRWYCMRRYGVIGFNAIGLRALVTEKAALIAKAARLHSLRPWRAAWNGWRAAKGEKIEVAPECLSRSITWRSRIGRSRRAASGK